MPAGRPRKYTLRKLKEKAETYFKETPFDEITITGLALSIGTTRELLCDYEKLPEFSDTIKNYKQRVQHSYEISLRKNGRAGDIFALKNFGWSDKQEIEVNDITQLSRTELENKYLSLVQKKAV